MTRAAIFDIDGTLVDSVDLHAEAWVEALRYFRINADYGAMRHEIGKGGDQLLPLFVPKAVLDERGDEITTYRADLFKRSYMSRVRPFPKVPDLFRRLRERGTVIVLASSAKADEVDQYAAIAGIEDLIDQKVSADDAERSKPDGDIFAAALARIAPLGPADSIAIGDTAWDIIAAKKVGLRTVAVRAGGFPEAELREAGAIAIYDDAADLLANLESSPLSG